MSNKIQTDATLIILSGIPASGKTTMLSKSIKEGLLPAEAIISEEDAKKSISGTIFTIKNGKVSKRRSALENAAAIIKEKVAARLKMHLPVVIDALSLSDRERREWIEIGQKYGAKHLVIIFKPSLSLSTSRDESRENPVGEEEIKNILNRFAKKSKFNAIKISPAEEHLLELTPHEIPEDTRLDVIGDIHGLHDQFIELAKKMGYEETEKGLCHKEGRRMLFLGDWIDRGPDSVKMMKTVMNMVENGHYAILGNHEFKLLRNLKNGLKQGSKALKRTMEDLEKSDIGKENLIAFLSSLKGYYVFRDMAITHAHLENFSPLNTPITELVYGQTKESKTEKTDEVYEELYHRGVNNYRLVRGHNIGKGNGAVTVLETGCYKGGKISALRVETEEIFAVETNFEYKENESL